MSIIQQYTFHINSEFRNSGTQCDMYYEMKTPLKLQMQNTAWFIKILNCIIPYSFQQINASVNSLNITVIDTLNNTVNGNILLTSGNYRETDLLTELKTQIINFCSNNFIGFIPTLTFTYNKTSNIVLFSTNSGNITINFTNVQGKFFGCSNPINFYNNHNAYSDKCVLINPVNSIFLRSGTLKQHRNKELISTFEDYSDILMRVPISSVANSYIVYDKTSEDIRLENLNLDKLNFYLTTNLNYDILDLRGLNFTFSMILYEQEIPEIDLTSEYQKIIMQAENLRKQKLKDDEEFKQLQIKKQVEDLQSRKDEINQKLKMYSNKIDNVNRKHDKRIGKQELVE